jgi:hypothetical protein
MCTTNKASKEDFFAFLGKYIDPAAFMCLSLGTPYLLFSWDCNLCTEDAIGVVLNLLSRTKNTSIKRLEKFQT